MEWSNDTPINSVLQFLLATIRHTESTTNSPASEQDNQLVEQWTEIFSKNLYENLAHLKDISADEWIALQVPLRLRTLGRMYIWEVDPSKKKKKESRRGSLIDFKLFQERTKRTKSSDLIKTERRDEKREEQSSSASFPSIYRVRTTEEKIATQPEQSTQPRRKGTKGTLPAMVRLPKELEQLLDDSNQIPNPQPITSILPLSPTSMSSTDRYTTNATSATSARSSIKKHKRSASGGQIILPEDSMIQPLTIPTNPSKESMKSPKKVNQVPKNGLQVASTGNLLTHLNNPIVTTSGSNLNSYLNSSPTNPNQPASSSQLQRNNSGGAVNFGKETGNLNANTVDISQIPVRKNFYRSTSGKFQRLMEISTIRTETPPREVDPPPPMKNEYLIELGGSLENIEKFHSLLRPLYPNQDPVRFSISFLPFLPFLFYILLLLLISPFLLAPPFSFVLLLFLLLFASSPFPSFPSPLNCTFLFPFSFLLPLPFLWFILPGFHISLFLPLSSPFVPFSPSCSHKNKQCIFA